MSADQYDQRFFELGRAALQQIARTTPEVTFDASEISSPSCLPPSECPGHLPEVQERDVEGQAPAEASEEVREFIPQALVLTTSEPGNVRDPALQEMLNAEPVATLVWWSREGAEQGKPWRVRHSDGSTALYAVVRVSGVLDFIDAPPEIVNLPDGPRGFGILREGTLLGGNR